MEGFDRLQSEFSGDVNYLNRLNVLLYCCNDAALNLDAHEWFHTLMVLYRELSTEMKVDKKTKKSKEMDKCEEFIEAIAPMISKNVDDINKKGTKIITSDLHKKLHQFEIYLRSIIKSSGLQNKMKEDASHALK